MSEPKSDNLVYVNGKLYGKGPVERLLELQLLQKAADETINQKIDAMVISKP